MKAIKFIPSVAFWFREEFLTAREAQYQASLDQFKKQGEPSNTILVEPDSDIICDFCSDLIDDPVQLINLVEYGRRVVCDTCYQKHYAKEPVKYRPLYEDGSLGSEVVDDGE